LGYLSGVILSGRRINDNMGKFIASDVIKLMTQKSIDISTVTVLILGITFKENCPDIRNSEVVDIIKELKSYSIEVEVYDPLVDKAEVEKQYNVKTIDNWSNNYQAIIIAVSYREFCELN
jgi:UDP-N-acetyl-D-galactosamine dehydrogenase